MTSKPIVAVALAATALCLSACANEEVQAGRARSAELQRQFTDKAATAAHYADLFEWLNFEPLATQHRAIGRNSRG